MYSLQVQKSLDGQPANGYSVNVATAIVVKDGKPAPDGTDVSFTLQAGTQALFANNQKAITVKVSGGQGHAAVAFSDRKPQGETAELTVRVDTVSTLQSFAFVPEDTPVKITLSGVRPGGLMTKGQKLNAAGSGLPALTVCVGQAPVFAIPDGGNATVRADWTWETPLPVVTDKSGEQAVWLTAFENSELFAMQYIRYVVS